MSTIDIYDVYSLHGLDQSKVKYMLENKIFPTKPIPVINDCAGNYFLADQHHRLFAWLLHLAGYTTFDMFANNQDWNFIPETIDKSIDVDITILDYDLFKIRNDIIKDNKGNIEFITEVANMVPYENDDNMEPVFYFYKNPNRLAKDKKYLTKYLKKIRIFRDNFMLKHHGTICENDVIRLLEYCEQTNLFSKVCIELSKCINFTNPGEYILIDFTNNTITDDCDTVTDYSKNTIKQYIEGITFSNIKYWSNKNQINIIL